MKKSKIIALFLVLAMSLSLAACGGKASSEPTETEKAVDAVATVPVAECESLEEIISAVDTSAKEMIKGLEDQYSDLKKSLDSYDAYKDNSQLLTNWYETVETSMQTFYDGMDAYYEAYYRMMFEQCEDDKSLDKALDNIYDDVYSGVFDDIYDDIYSGILDDAYDDFYNGILDDAYDEVEYKEWSDASSACYKEWSDATSTCYKLWSDGSSRFHTIWSVMSGSIYSGNHDYDSLMEEVNKRLEELAADQKRKSEEVDFEITYEVRDGKAVVVGYSGEGNHATISSSYDGHDVVAIADSAFEGCKELQSVLFWADIEEIGNSAFKDCTSLVEISIPGETTIIGDHAFENCGALKDLIVWGNPEIGDYAFANCTSLTEISISSDTKMIGAHAYEGCASVESLIIWGVEEIGEYAFAGCTSIADVSFPSEVKIIRTHAFDGCSALESVIVWGRDTKVEKDAFINCPKLTDKPAEVKIQPATEKPQSTAKTDKPETKEPTTSGNNSANGIRPEFQKAIDEYVAFFDEYYDFLMTYYESENSAKLQSEYTSCMQRYVDIMEDLEKLVYEGMSEAEMELYFDIIDDLYEIIFS